MVSHEVDLDVDRCAGFIHSGIAGVVLILLFIYCHQQLIRICRIPKELTLYPRQKYKGHVAGL